MIDTFSELGLKETLVEGLKKADITEPTEIQEKIIPLALEKKDLIGQSETGSGKTLAYLLPIFQNTELAGGVQTIILAPTHELASQIKRQVELLATNSGEKVTSALIIGEVNIKRQIDKLKEKPNVIVGSPGRILELIEKKKINAHNLKTLVIDEADYMLNKKNIDTVKKIIKTTQKERQIMIFSASILHGTIETAKEIMNNPELVKAESTRVPKNIEHRYYLPDTKGRVELLRRLIDLIKPSKAIVFVKTNEDMEHLTQNTKYHGLKIGGLFGSLDKEERKKMLDDFRKGTIQVLFATDIAARGLDVKGITHVFNFGLLDDSKTYLHRSGRTGRQNDKGIAISIINSEEKELVKKFEKELGIEITEHKI